MYVAMHVCIVTFSTTQPQLLIPFPNTTTTDNYGLGCFSDKNVSVCVCVCVCVCMRTCAWVCAHVVHVCACVYIYISHVSTFATSAIKAMIHTT